VRRASGALSDVGGHSSAGVWHFFWNLEELSNGGIRAAE
jgi:hypothetical protein